MFWALEMDPGKVYKQKVEKSYHVSMACLQPSKCTDSNYTTLVVRKDGNEFVLCNLHKDKIVQVQLDLMFGTGDEIAFSLVGGKNNVYLSGYVVEDDEDKLFDGSDSDLEDSTLDEEVNKIFQVKRKVELPHVDNKNKKRKPSAEQLDEDSDTSDDDEDGYEQDEEDDNDEEDDEGEDEDEDEEESESGSESDDELESEEESTPVKGATAKSPDKAKKKTPNAKQQINENVQQQKTPMLTPDSQVNGKTPKSKKKNKGNKTPGGDENAATPKMQKTPDSSKEDTPKKIKLQGGVVAIDTKVGAGAPAKAGRRVAVYYTGRLQHNNKEFDSTTQGKGFIFQLGRGEVIKGWDVGVAGMKVGGKRKIIVPSAMGYGIKGSPPVIPPNSNLVFDVELKNIY